MPESAAQLDLLLDQPLTPARPTSVLGVRRSYWEITHGWSVPGLAQDDASLDAPGRVA